MAYELKPQGKLNNTEYMTCGEDILIALPPPGYKDTAVSARAVTDYQANYARQLGKRVGLIVVMNNVLTQDAASRQVYSEGMRSDLFYGIAMVINNPLARAISSFAVAFTRTDVTITMVDSVDSGIKWLESVRPSS